MKFLNTRNIELVRGGTSTTNGTEAKLPPSSLPSDPAIAPTSNLQNQGSTSTTTTRTSGYENP